MLFEIAVIFRPTFAFMLLNIFAIPIPKAVMRMDEKSIKVPSNIFSEGDTLSNALTLIVTNTAIKIPPIIISNIVPKKTPAIAHFSTLPTCCRTDIKMWRQRWGRPRQSRGGERRRQGQKRTRFLVQSPRHSQVYGEPFFYVSAVMELMHDCV